MEEPILCFTGKLFLPLNLFWCVSSAIETAESSAEFPLWQKLITLLNLHKQNNSQLKYNESLWSVKCGKSFYSFICSFIQ